MKMFAIKVHTYYLPGALYAPPVEQWMQDVDYNGIGERLQFETQESAEKYMLEMGYTKSSNGKSFYMPGAYYLSHGEYDRPRYYVRRVKKGNATPQKRINEIIEDHNFVMNV